MNPDTAVANLLAFVKRGTTLKIHETLETLFQTTVVFSLEYMPFKHLKKRHFPGRGGPLCPVDVTLTQTSNGYRVRADPPDRTSAPIEQFHASESDAEAHFAEIVRLLEEQWKRTPRWED